MAICIPWPLYPWEKTPQCPLNRGSSGQSHTMIRLHLKCASTRTETRFCLSAKWTSPFKSAGASVQSTTGSRGMRISGSNAGYTMFRVSVKSTRYPLHSPVSTSLPLTCVTVCHRVSTARQIQCNAPLSVSVTHIHLTAFRGSASTTSAYVGTIGAFQNQSSFQTGFCMVLRVIYCEEFPRMPS